MTRERVTEEEIRAARTEKGGWTKDVLAAWGVPWPPPKGWRQRLVAGGAPDSARSEQLEKEV